MRDALKQDPEGTVRAVAQMGYQAVEFYAPYFEWTEPQAKQMRKLLDDLGIRCYSTHNDEDFFSAKKIDHARELNLILGTKYMVQAWSDPKPDLDAWKEASREIECRWRSAGAQWTQGRVSQPRRRVEGCGWPTAHRDSRGQYQAIGHVAARRWDMP